MGYFNYRFICELLKNKKIKKCLLIIITFLIIIFIKNKCFATVDFTYNNVDYHLDDFPVYYVYNVVLYIPPKAEFSPNPMTGAMFLWVGADNPISLKETISGSRYKLNIVYGGNSFNYGTARCINISTGNTSWSNLNTYNNITQDTTTGFNFSSVQQVQSFIAYSNQDLYVYYMNGTNEEIYSPPPVITNFPHFLNDSDSIAEGGQSIVIMPGDFTNTQEIRFCIQSVTEENNIISYNNLFTPVSLTKDSPYYVGSDEGFYYSIPWNFINSYITLSNKYNYVIAYEFNNQTEKEEIEVVYGGTTPEDAIYNQGLNQQDLINQQTDAINNQTQVIEEQTQAIEGINNTISDPSIDTGASDLPSVDVNDPSQNGIDNIFQSIYNAFCTGQAQDIIFPIPFTNKNITLNPYYVRDMLNNYGATWIYTLIQAFWGYIIGRYIVKDVSKKITKIKGGNIENLENENIKEEML